VNRTERLTAILLLLQERPRTAEQIARTFEVSRRTILRDMQALSEIGVPLIAREGAGGGYALPDHYTLAPLALTPPEAFLLLLALRPLTQLSEVPFAQARASLLAKLHALLPAPQPEVAQLLATVDAGEPERPQRAPFLETLLAAAQAGRWVCVTYQSAERARAVHLLPRTLTTRAGLWYCRAYCHEAGEERTYRLDRVQSVDDPAPEFAPGPVPPPRAYDDPAHPEIVVRVTARGAAALEAERDLAGELAPNGDGTFTLRFRCPPSEFGWYTRLFGGLGPETVVLAPPELCDRLARLGQKLVGQYPER
jgi:predicted DNA-binding transcriptional regulator YafY